MPRKKNAVQEEKNPSQNELSTAMEQTTVSAVVTLSTKSSTKIIYYLMVVDGEVFHNEEEKFDSVCSELDPDFAAHKEGIIRECKAQMDKIIDSDDFYDVIQDGIEEAIIASTKTKDTFITPKLLVWDLLSIA